MEINSSFDMPSNVSAVRVLDFDQMEYKFYEDTSQISFANLQNVVSDEDDDRKLQIPDDIIVIPSYDNFVKNLNERENDEENEHFENVKNSTAMEDLKANANVNNLNIVSSNDSSDEEECVQTYINVETSDETSLQVYFDAITSDIQHVIFVEDITNRVSHYDLEHLWSQAEITTFMDEAEITTYMELPPELFASSKDERVEVALGNVILTTSDTDADTSAPSFQDILQDMEMDE